MKITLALIVSIAGALPLFAQTPKLVPTVAPKDLTGSTVAEWVDGAEKPITRVDSKGDDVPYRLFWGPGAPFDRIIYGESKALGPRYLGIRLKSPTNIGSILMRGIGQVSVLKPGASLPGALNDDSQWIPAQRLQNGAVTTDEPAGLDNEVLWTFPEVESTQAIRITHNPKPTDLDYAGVLNVMALFPARAANIAPQAIAMAGAANGNAGHLTDDSARSSWENISSRDGERPKTIADRPEWIMLLWPRPVTLAGTALVGSEFGAADVQAFTGPAGAHPNEAPDSDWQTVATISGAKPQVGPFLDMYPLAFDQPVTTRALRVRFTATYEEVGNMTGHTRDGKRVGLVKWLALQSLDAAPLASAILPVERTAESHPPIPIKFSIPDAGEVTLVIEDSTGKRVRNLVSQTPFPKGENTVWWDGTDDLGRDKEAAAHGVYFIPPNFVAPGSYTVRGIWHKPLDIRYEFNVYLQGDPPWSTADQTGGWMTNHTPASCAVFIPGNKAPGGQPLMGIGASVSEGGSAFSWVNMDGKKVGGRGWIGGVWTGAAYLAGDYGPNAEPNVACYVGNVFEGNKKYGINGKLEIRLTKLTTLTPSGDKPVLKQEIILDSPPPHAPGAKRGTYVEASDYLGGMAVHNGLMVISETTLNKIVFIDVKAGTVLGEAPLNEPRALAFDNDGHLYAISGHDLVRFGADVSASNASNPEKIATGFDQPRGLTVDASGKIYVSDQGASNQVKTFTPDGKPGMVYGKAGPSKAGMYDPLHMNSPKGIAVDPKGRLWVTEDDFHPKRVSVWGTDGGLLTAWYGPHRYGGGGILDPKQQGAFLYDGMEFALDWDKGTWKLTRVYYRPEDPAIMELPFRDGPPEAVAYFNGKRYISNEYNSNPVSGQPTAVLFLDKGDGGAVVPVAAAGRATDWPILKTDAFKANWPAGIDPNAKDTYKTPTFFIWSDLNGDGQAQPGEVKIIAGTNGGVSVGDDGSFLISRLGPDRDHQQATRFKPVKFTEAGVPVYDIAAGETLAPAQGPGSDGGDQVLVGTDGWVVMTTPPPPFSNFGLGGAHNGAPAWSYPSLWPGLHASHSSPAPTQLGELVGTTRLLGGLVTPKGAESGPLFFINSNQGNVYAFTQDGLFVSQIFQDVRQGPVWEMPTAVRNMRVNDVSLHDECFFPSVAQNSAGQVYVNTGGYGLTRVDNLDTIRTIAPSKIDITAADLAKAQQFVVAREAARQAAQGSGVLDVSLVATPPAVDANLEAWNDFQWAPIDQRGTRAYFDSHTRPYDVNGAVAIGGGKLYAAWKTGDPILTKNAGDVPNALFKSGGALDLMIGADPSANPNRPAAVAGDERLLVSQVNGKPKALLYRAVVPNTPEKDKVPFNAPWHGITLDRVDDVTSQVEFAANKTGDYEIAIPLSVLGLNPAPGARIKGDIGVLRGDGKQTTQRVYWANKATAIVSDVPSEAELTPKLWGIWQFTQK